jgi:hypothetical protein
MTEWTSKDGRRGRLFVCGDFGCLVFDPPTALDEARMIDEFQRRNRGLTPRELRAGQRSLLEGDE